MMNLKKYWNNTGADLLKIEDAATNSGRKSHRAVCLAEKARCNTVNEPCPVCHWDTRNQETR